MKKKIGNTPLIYPIPIVLIGTQYEGKNNFTTIGDIAIMGINPSLIVISLLESHLATRNILLNRVFSVNLPSIRDLDKIDYCGIVSGNDSDKSALFSISYGEDASLPLINECPVSLECEVIKHFIFERRNVFIAKVNHTWLDDTYKPQSASNNLPSMIDLDPIIYSMDNHYYSIGNEIGKGYQEGKRIVNQPLNQE